MTSTTARASDYPRVTFHTSLGNFTFELNSKKAPITTNNFLRYAGEGFYDGTIFHRVIPGFMVQGGGFVSGMSEKKNQAPIKNEAKNGLQNKRGTIAMARTNVVDSATSQFFINLVDNAFLDHSPRNFGYAVFGTVISGMEVIDAMAKTRTAQSGHHDDVPIKDITILRTIVDK